MVRGSIARGGEVGAVRNGKIVPKLLVGVSCCKGNWGRVSLCPSIVVIDWGDGSGVAAQEESPSNIIVISGIRAG